MNTKIYACYNKEDYIREISSSGGIYYLLAKNVINSGGVVYAACYDGVDVIHRRINLEEDIFLSCGSKYVASVLGSTFKKIRDDLASQKTVLFVGTPCQTAGLLSFTNDADRLICVDIICHGVPSSKTWHAYVASIEKTWRRTISAVNMRDKSSGWMDYSFSVFDNRGKNKKKKHQYNPYMKGFIEGLYLRPSCYHCSFKGIERLSDLTLGDFWGVKNVCPEFFDNKGTSIVYVHTEKGASVFSDIFSSIECKEISEEESIQCNSSIIKSSAKHRDRERFFHDINENEDFIKTVKKYTYKSVYQRGLQRMKNLNHKVMQRLRGGGETA